VLGLKFRVQAAPLVTPALVTLPLARAPTGGVTRQGVALTDLQTLQGVALTDLQSLLDCQQNLSHTLSRPSPRANARSRNSRIHPVPRGPWRFPPPPPRLLLQRSVCVLGPVSRVLCTSFAHQTRFRV
jgi:hypothetical protein